MAEIKKEKGKALIALKPSQKRKMEEESSSDEDSDSSNEPYNSSDSSSSSDEIFEENVALKEIISVKAKSKKLVIIKSSICKNKKLRKSGVPVMLVDTVEKAKVEE
ncbi:hypothetical protein PVK06_048789 [Gossypium arboreum]|uniref:Uncharacterized protein n=1 Tax=Gossypium arboreum TaxID=29729 RepID=A0ABR0MHF1_GOSAR|nr:hypothetical protein PVK06_048789 [Gossypium arboreum]